MEVDPEHGSRRNERNAGRAEELALAGRGGDEYHPAFVKLGTPHPDRVCETQALSYATVPRPTYTPLMKTEEGALSTVQAETLIYANQRFGCFSADGSRAGFFLGDGVGLGKGRQLAAIIYENWLHGRKRHVWLSVSPDLLKDAQRDLRDIGASGLPLHALAAQPYGRLEVPDGVLFATYTTLVMAKPGRRRRAKENTRLGQLAEWMQDGEGCLCFDEAHRAKNLAAEDGGAAGEPGSNGASSQVAVAVQQLQRALPRARVVYCSATGASSVKAMAYMARLGLWGPGTSFGAFGDFARALDGSSHGALELVALDLKSRGAYMARQLSFHAATFETRTIELGPSERALYDNAAALWRELYAMWRRTADTLGPSAMSTFWGAHQRFFKQLVMSLKVRAVAAIALDAVKEGKCVVIGLQGTGEARMADANWHKEDLRTYSASLAIVQQLLDKMRPAESCSRDDSPYAPPVGAMGPDNRAARALRPQRDRPYQEAASDDSSASTGSYAQGGSDDGGEAVESPLRKRRALPAVGGASSARVPCGGSPPLSAEAADEGAIASARWLSSLESRMRDLNLPDLGPLDQLLDELGGHERVAEMTGRKSRLARVGAALKMVSRGGNWQTNDAADSTNQKERDEFMAGRKRLAIISEAASSGISLHADKRCESAHMRRVHITLELPWSSAAQRLRDPGVAPARKLGKAADAPLAPRRNRKPHAGEQAIQQCGRTHRSNQQSAPHYILVVTDVAGERRFVSAVAKRLQALGALTRGDRHASDASDLAAFDVDNRYGAQAVDSTLAQIFAEADARRPLRAEGLPQPPIMRAVGLEAGDLPGWQEYLAEAKDTLSSAGITGRAPKIAVKSFLNRLLGLPIGLQKRLFSHFAAHVEESIRSAKRRGKYDEGVIDLSGDQVHIIGKPTVAYAGAGAEHVQVMHYVLQADRGLAYRDAHSMLKGVQADADAGSGFYRSETDVDGWPGRKRYILAIAEPASTDAAGTGQAAVAFSIQSPAIGALASLQTLQVIRKSWVPVEPEQARAGWVEEHVRALRECSHGLRCKKGPACSVGRRLHAVHLLCGTLLPIWAELAQAVQVGGGQAAALRITRVHTREGTRLVGVQVADAGAMSALLRDLVQKEADQRAEVERAQPVCPLDLGAAGEQPCDQEMPPPAPSPAHAPPSPLPDHQTQLPSRRGGLSTKAWSQVLASANALVRMTGAAGDGGHLGAEACTWVQSAEQGLKRAVLMRRQQQTQPLPQ